MITRFKKVNARLSQESVDEVHQHLDGIQETLNFLIDLTAKERHRLPKMSRKSAEFVQRCLMHAEERPGFLPAFVPLSDFQNDKNLSEQLREIDVRVSALHKNLKSTIMMVESELYRKSRLYYKTASAAQKEGKGDAEIIVKDLEFEFKQKPSSKNEEGNEEGEDNLDKE
jgi:hypothetical protein